MSKSALRRLAVFVLDLVCTGLSYWLALALRYGWAQAGVRLASDRPMAATLLFLVAALNLVTRLNRGFMQRRGWQEFRCVVEYNLLLVLGVAVLAAAFHVEPLPSRLMVGYLGVLNMAVMCVGRWLAKRAARAAFADQRLGSGIVMVVGPGLRDEVERHFRLGLTYSVAGWLTLSDGELEGEIQGHELRCKAFELGHVVHDLDVTAPADFFVWTPEEDEHVVAQLVNAVERLGSRCRVALELPYSSLQGATLDYFGGIPSLSYAPGGTTFYRRYVKRILDVVFCLLVFVLFWWVFLAVAIAVKVDDPAGPVIFRQKRVGKDGRTFTMYKYRSMYVDAEQRLGALRRFNEKDGPVFKMKDDPRVTRVGRFIRKTSLDEFPQFVNVLKGDMSVVGPRPAIPGEVEAYTSYQRERLLARPGLTCYWQIQHNRDDISFDEWVDLDLLYIRQCSLRVDAKVVSRTVGVVLGGEGH